MPPVPRPHGHLSLRRTLPSPDGSPPTRTGPFLPLRDRRLRLLEKPYFLLTAKADPDVFPLNPILPSWRAILRCCSAKPRQLGFFASSKPLHSGRPLRP